MRRRVFACPKPQQPPSLAKISRKDLIITATIGVSRSYSFHTTRCAPS